jgi:hypothetical protein
MTTKQEVSTQDQRRIAAEAECDARTVARYVAGEPVRPLVEERIKRAATKLKIKLSTEK